MNRRGMLMAGAATVLAVLNAWHWFGNEAPSQRKEKVSAASTVSAKDLVLYAESATEIPAPTRNPFQPKLAIVAAPVKQPPPPPAPVLPPPKTAEELEAEAARAELAAIKLVGVVFKNNKPQAFLVKGDQMFLATAGEKVAGRFTVDKITEDAVLLSDPKTAVSGRVAISGS